MQQGPCDPPFILHSFLMAQDRQVYCAYTYVDDYSVEQWHIDTDTAKNCLEHE